MTKGKRPAVTKWVLVDRERVFLKCDSLIEEGQQSRRMATAYRANEAKRPENSSKAP